MVSCRLEKAHPMATGQAKGISLDVHPDGDIELDIDEKAGVNPGDSQVVADVKINAYLQRQGIKELKWQWFFYGLVCAALLVWLFGPKVFDW